MRYLGIDFGTKRVGIALSDEKGEFAMPHSVVQNTPSLVEDVKNICVKEGVGTIVIGESKDYAMNNNPVMKKVIPFVKKLETETGLPVVYEPEVLSSREAGHIQGEGKLLDASAAAIILKSYIDRGKK
ncbi:MAG: Holliday junction resolvase RuvX [Candidatus Paceibacterota bacterium]|jgi:putative Holliday junction resolvase